MPGALQKVWYLAWKSAWLIASARRPVTTHRTRTKPSIELSNGLTPKGSPASLSSSTSRVDFQRTPTYASELGVARDACTTFARPRSVALDLRDSMFSTGSREYMQKVSYFSRTSTYGTRRPAGSPGPRARTNAPRKGSSEPLNMRRCCST